MNFLCGVAAPTAVAFPSSRWSVPDGAGRPTRLAVPLTEPMPGPPGLRRGPPREETPMAEEKDSRRPPHLLLAFVAGLLGLLALRAPRDADESKPTAGEKTAPRAAAPAGERVVAEEV